MTDRLREDLISGDLSDPLAAIAEAAAAVILPWWRSGLAAEFKADDSPVTQADRAAEALILARLGDLYPEVQAVAEEAAEADGLPARAGSRFWLIDPLDGTRGFVRGGENFTVNIALIEDGRPVAGVVTAPALATTWRTTPGGAERRRFDGAWEPIRVRDRPETALALVSHSLTAAEAEALARDCGCAAWEGLDSSLKFCRLAEGAADAYPRNGPTMEWDTAAGQAVLEAAGGRMIDPDGAPFAYGKPGFRNGGFLATGR